MSAHICSEKHLAAMVGTHINNLSHRGRILPDSREITEMFALLAEANAESVNYRYKSSPQEAVELSDGGIRDLLRYTQEPLSVAQMDKAMDCYRHQACEHPGWEDSAARKATMVMKVSLVGSYSPDDYNNAEWCL